MPATNPRYAVYVRRSLKREGDADISDEQQEAAARARIPPGAEVILYADSGGTNSGYSADRPAYQRMLEAVRSGELSGIAAYDDSRLNRNAQNALALYDVCEQAGVVVLTGSTTSETFLSTGGWLPYSMQAIVAEHLRRAQSAKMRDIAATAFENGQQRGPDPYGYRTRRDERGRVAHPRTLDVVEEEASVVRRVFEELARRPMADVAAVLNADGVAGGRRMGPWNKEHIRELWRRRRLYLGYAIRKRSEDERPGTHPPILDADSYRLAVAAMTARRTANTSPRRRQRIYILSGVLFCGDCGSRLRGEARLARGNEWRYYTCPVSDRKLRVLRDDGQPLTCSARRVIADLAEQQVLERIAAARLPDAVVEEARALLRQRLAAPADDEQERRRQRLQAGLENLRKQHQWGDLSDEIYRREREALEEQMPRSSGKVVEFDRYRQSLRDMSGLLTRGRPDQLRELVSTLVERIEARDRQLVSILWTPPARPFLASFWRAVWDSNPRHED